jgi:hypothetical protein
VRRPVELGRAPRARTWQAFRLPTVRPTSGTTAPFNSGTTPSIFKYVLFLIFILILIIYFIKNKIINICYFIILIFLNKINY